METIFAVFAAVVKLEKDPAAPGLLTIFASIPGKFNDVGVAGVSCVIGNNGFSKNGNDGSLKEQFSFHLKVVK